MPEMALFEKEKPFELFQLPLEALVEPHSELLDSSKLEVSPLSLILVSVEQDLAHTHDTFFLLEKE